MTPNENPTAASGGSNVRRDIEKAGSRLEEEKQAASKGARETRDKVKEAGAALTERARDEADAQGAKLKDRTAAELDNFAEAIRAASDRLSEKQPGAIADLVRQASRGLEGMSRTLKGRSTSELLDNIRDFGRHNPTAFIAGSVLAGFAVGRFAGSSTPQNKTPGPRRNTDER